jgi:mono/diheme cytochrome c family protein
MKNRLAVLLIVLAVFASQSRLIAAEPNEGKKLYQTYCSGCHGNSGRGDGPAAKTLPVKPADHTRGAMNKYSDQSLAEIIAKGGASVGKSAQMPAWGSILKEPQIAALVTYIRSLSAGSSDTSRSSRTTK